MRLIRMLLVLMISCTSMALAAGEFVLRTVVQPMEGWVGQRVVLQVDVLSENGWAQISRFGDVELPGAYMIRTESQGTRLQETIDGKAYTGQRCEVSVYPQKAGAIAVPPLPVEVTVKTWGTDGSQAVQQKRTPAVTITAKLPPGAQAIRGLISTTRFAAEQQWSAKTESPKVGDALKRTVTMQAEDLSAMAIVPLDYPDLPGVGIYPAEPRVNDSADRGSLTGKRTETVPYWRGWRKRRFESEARYFRRALRSIRSADAHLAPRDIMRWLDRLNDSDWPAQMRDFLHRHGDANALLAIDQTMRSVAADGRWVDSAALLHSLQKARKHWREAGQHRPNAPFELPELDDG